MSVDPEILPGHDPDDEDMEETPPDVIDILGFDPIEEAEESPEKLASKVAEEWLKAQRSIKYN
jgi:hypothetical protein